jgi:hypothetical protein
MIEFSNFSYFFHVELYLKLYIILSRVLPRRRLGDGIGWILNLHRRHLIVRAARVWVCGRPPFAVAWQSQCGRVGVLDFSLCLMLVDWRRWWRFWVSRACHKRASRGNKRVWLFYSKKTFSQSPFHYTGNFCHFSQGSCLLRALNLHKLYGNLLNSIFWFIAKSLKIKFTFFKNSETNSYSKFLY